MMYEPYFDAAHVTQSTQSSCTCRAFSQRTVDSIYYMNTINYGFMYLLADNIARELLGLPCAMYVRTRL